MAKAYFLRRKISFSARRLSTLYVSLLTAIIWISLAALGLYATLQWSRAAAAPAPKQDTVSPDGVWQESGEATPRRDLPHLRARAYRELRLERATLTRVLAAAPREFSAPESWTVLSLPLPDGSFARFRVVEAPVMEPELAAKFPEIKTYRGQGIDDPAATARFSWSPHGFHALLLDGAEQMVTIRPLRHDDLTTYISYAGQGYFNGQDFQCLLDQVQQPAQGNADRPLLPRVSLGGARLNYRLAVAATQEYTTTPNLGGGTVNSALASIVTWINSVNLIYERDLSVHFNLVANNNQIIYANNDPFTNGSAITMLAEVRTVLGNVIGAANYDVGHVLGTGASGVAYLGVACENGTFDSNGPLKGGGVSLIAASAAVGDNWHLTRIAHELGHQFGANHTFDVGAVGTRAVGFTAAPNPGPACTGALTVAGRPFTVAQNAATSSAAPLLATLSPNNARAGSAGFTLTVTGTGFVSGAVVNWNGGARQTTFFSATQLTAVISAVDLADKARANITVHNPAGGGVSNILNFNVTGTATNVSAASYLADAVAPEGIESAFGTELATATQPAPHGQPLPTTLAGTTVKVRDSSGVERLAPLFFVSALQINYLIPAGTALGQATVTITSSNGMISLGMLQVARVAPGLFSASASGQGVATGQLLRVFSNGVQRYEAIARFDQTLNKYVAVPIAIGPGSEQLFLVLYGTGLRSRSALSAVTASIGGLPVEVHFAGPQGTFIGLDQVNLRIPRTFAGRGELDVMLAVDGKQTNAVKVLIR